MKQESFVDQQIYMNTFIFHNYILILIYTQNAPNGLLQSVNFLFGPDYKPKLIFI